MLFQICSSFLFLLKQNKFNDMMRRLLNRWLKPMVLLFSLGVATGVSMAQENPIYNQYYFNYYLVNPALAGANDCHYFMLTHKQQWMGIKDAPMTTSFSYQGRLPHNVGLGVYFYNDMNGYSIHQAGQISVAYHIPLSDGYRYKKAVARDRQLSFAVSLKFFNYGFIADELKEVSAGDMAMQDLSSKFTINSNVGVYFTSYGFFTGLSMTNFLRTKMPAYSKDLEPNTAIAGYFNIGNAFTLSNLDVLEPSAMFKFDFDGHLGLDVSLRYDRDMPRHKNFSWWCQATYRQNFDGPYQGIDILPMVGFQFNKFHIAAAYDIPINKLFRHSAGSLELMLGYTLCYTKRFCR